MHMTMLLIRILAAFIDLSLVYWPFRFILGRMYDVDILITDLLSQIVLVLYFTIATHYSKGQTIGKYFGKIMVEHLGGFNDSLAHTSLREVCKLIYFLPYAGIPLFAISVIMIAFTNTSLHDYVGKSRVIPKKR